MSIPKLFTSKKTSWVIASVFYLALLVFLFFYLRSINFDAIAHMQISWPFVIVASLFGLGMRYWQLFVWIVILRGLGAEGLEKSKHQLGYVYAQSWMARYIPGTAPAIVGKIYFASRHGISKSKLALSSVIEAAIQVTGLLALSSLLLALDQRFSAVDERLRVLMIVFLAGCLLLLTPAVFNRILALGYKLLRRGALGKSQHVSAMVLYRGVLLYVIGGFFYGLFIFFAAKSVFPALDYTNMLFVIGAANLAGLLGILAIFTPSGLGVRDGTQLVLFSLVMPPEFALTVTILTRLWDIVLDVLFFAFAWVRRGRRS